MIIVGIDPGANGSVSILNTYAFHKTYALPLSKNTLVDVYLLLASIRGGEVDRRAKHVVELSKEINRVSPRHPINLPTDILDDGDNPDNSMEIWLEEPGQIVINRKMDGNNKTNALLAGMTASRKLGRSVGQWEGIAAALNTSITLVPPKEWQKSLGCDAKGDKRILKNCAISIFSFLTNANGESTITLDIADSLLIAAYAYMQYADRKYWPASLKEYLKSAGIRLPTY